MYAVVLTGGKQYQVSEGDVISVELLKDAQKGASIELDKVLMVADGDNVRVGAPYLEGGKVVEAAPSKQFFENPTEERVREFIRKIQNQ